MLALAARQGNNVHRDQLVELGMTHAMIRHRRASGVLQERLPRVYRVGDLDPPHSAEFAAVLWAGGDARVGRLSAAHVLGAYAPPDVVEVTVTTHNPGRAEGVLVRRPRRDPLAAPIMIEGLRVAAPLDVVADCAPILLERQLEHLLGEFQVKELVGDEELIRTAALSLPGMPLLRGILDDTIGLTRSEAERMLRRLLHEAQLPLGFMNVEVAGHEVDVHWPKHRLVLEFHGYGPHRTRKKFERDGLKSEALAREGVRLMYATWRRLRREPMALAASLGAALATRG
jgi:hypothetical protein